MMIIIGINTVMIVKEIYNVERSFTSSTKNLEQGRTKDINQTVAIRATSFVVENICIAERIKNGDMPVQGNTAQVKCSGHCCMDPQIVNSFTVSLQIIMRIISQASDEYPHQVDNKSY